MKLEIIPVTPLQQNCSLLTCEQTRQAVLVDPGGDAQKLIDRVTELEVGLDKLLLTHGHFDHAGSAAELADYWGVPVVGPQQEDNFLLESIPEWSANYHLEGRSVTPDRWLSQGDIVEFGEQKLDVYHCPGHTPGHVVFIHAQERLAFVGDVLFKGSIGRSDFPRGDHAKLIDSIINKLLPLGDDIQFVPGHGAMSSFGEERQSNPFIR
ncbi:MAG: MBL fold metallo-hydrolase [Gammaproteobacteria bacterium]|jgi:glyoxylase-like metal-dependent hydrolase (beta-lactamase superfamily II)|nr:MBL fold metallo-hydrolase [Gammaproteobacteria bacterium]MBT3846150.1 MBL fold metallo-hydrolase [Gammaproteobacteria bacterium]MBT4301732.1 MBL fold metallo-hydrolase [Gammaproteobacteria bacterium]MBT5687926.1 MBL fold metallo-hydrolase [Gammaproteobacteria bacterium]MBT6651180.1 MBL fold metallo-hydrolase [Gammaproteobacteria bacterium]